MKKVWNKSKCILYLRFFKVATLWLDDSFADSWHSLKKNPWMSRCVQTFDWSCICFKQKTIVPVSKNTKETCLNHPVALTSVAIKCFERLVMAHINTIIPDTLDPLQFAYRPNRSTDDAIFIALHTALSHLDIREPLCENTVHWLQLSVPHHSALQAHH